MSSKSNESLERAKYLQGTWTHITAEIHQAALECKRDPSTIRLVAVSKTKPYTDIALMYESTGQRHYGENYVQELVTKASQLPHEIQWHFIGHLQSNKAKQIASIPNLFMVESLDSANLATHLNKYRYPNLPPIGVYIQINVSNEESKSGISSTVECLELIKYVMSHCPRLKVSGLMTIGAPGDSVAGFVRLAEYRDYLLLNIDGLDRLDLSMGMSDDFPAAIEYGSNNVRVGSLLFGSRI